MAAGRIILSADDYGLTAGVSRGIAELAEAGRLSATGAMVTEAEWEAGSAALPTLRSQVAVGLHLNLTTGSPLGPMPRTVPDGRFGGIGPLLKSALLGRLAADEIAAEIRRQLDRFEAVAGMPPDFIDGHHHVHVLPTVRPALIAAVAGRYRDRPPLIRNPGDRIGRILARRHSASKALVIAALARHFGADARRAGIPTNDGFSGFSSFDRRIRFEDELTSFLRAPGPRQIIMCHPGYPDDRLKALDPLSDRRLDELNALKTLRGIEQWIARPRRGSDGRIAWP